MIQIQLDTKPLIRSLNELQRKHVPFAASLAVNAVAFQVMQAERNAMTQVFKSPRPFTQKSTLVRKASKQTLTATVFVKPEAARYLAPYETGGLHYVPGKALLVPEALKLDRYGQITPRQRQLLNDAANDPRSGIFFATIRGIKGYWQRPVYVPDSAPQRMGYLLVRRKSKQAPLRLVAKVEESGEVHADLGFMARAEKVAQHEWPGAFAAAITQAIATAR